MVECNGNVASGNNVLQILALHAAKGSVLDITADGPDEDAAIAKIEEVLADIAPKAKKREVLKVAFFGTKDYDRMFFSELSRDKGEGTYNVDIKYFNSRLTIESANLAKGYDLESSIHKAKDYISGALAAMLDLGQESGPMNHAFDLNGKYATTV